MIYDKNSKNVTAAILEYLALGSVFGVFWMFWMFRMFRMRFVLVLRLYDGVAILVFLRGVGSFRRYLDARNVG